MCTGGVEYAIHVQGERKGKRQGSQVQPIVLYMDMKFHLFILTVGHEWEYERSCIPSCWGLVGSQVRMGSSPKAMVLVQGLSDPLPAMAQVPEGSRIHCPTDTSQAAEGSQPVSQAAFRFSSDETAQAHPGRICFGREE